MTTEQAQRAEMFPRLKAWTVKGEMFKARVYAETEGQAVHEFRKAFSYTGKLTVNTEGAKR